MDIILYDAEDGEIRLEVRMAQETVWLSQRQMSDLFDKDTDTIGLHIRNIYKEGELTREGTTEESWWFKTKAGAKSNGECVFITWMSSSQSATVSNRSAAFSSVSGLHEFYASIWCAATQ